MSGFARSIWLAVLSALELLAFAAALVYFLARISSTLRRIGGSPDSYLAKLRFGVRAIERETSHLAPQVTRLNQGLSELGETLAASDAYLRATALALSGEGAGEVTR